MVAAHTGAGSMEEQTANKFTPAHGQIRFQYTEHLHQSSMTTRALLEMEHWSQASPHFSQRHRADHTVNELRASPDAASSDSAPPLNVCIVGAGPCGLLLSHLLLQQPNVNVSIIDGRADPQSTASQPIDSRASALGLGIRARTAIRSVDETLWQAVKNSGFESERFQLHTGPFVIPLRNEEDSVQQPGKVLEPSVLVYQAEICRSLWTELEQRHGNTGRLNAMFNCKVEDCDLSTMQVSVDSKDSSSSQPYDLVVGCDGVNSIVRKAMDAQHPSFETKSDKLPNQFKVIKLDRVPPTIDPLAVSLVLPKAGRVTAFIEPTNSGGCCILFTSYGRDGEGMLSNTDDAAAMRKSLTASYPQWGEDVLEDVAAKLMDQNKAGKASAVICNTYNYGGKAALAGDAAHATGGVTGQGVNAAMLDSLALAESIRDHRDDLPKALLEYSKKQVPQGKALYDLSFGPKATGLKHVAWSLYNARDALFHGKYGVGKAPLQTRMTTTLESFAALRRERDTFFKHDFPTENDFEYELDKLHHEGMKIASTHNAMRTLKGRMVEAP